MGRMLLLYFLSNPSGLFALMIMHPGRAAFPIFLIVIFTHMESIYLEILFACGTFLQHSSR